MSEYVTVRVDGEKPMKTLWSVQERMILVALRKSRGNRSAAARRLGVSRKTLGRWIGRMEAELGRSLIEAQKDHYQRAGAPGGAR